jgi:hypothetical protein
MPAVLNTLKTAQEPVRNPFMTWRIFSFLYTANEKRTLEKTEESFSVSIFRMRSSEKAYFYFTAISSQKC